MLLLVGTENRALLEIKSTYFKWRQFDFTIAQMHNLIIRNRAGLTNVGALFQKICGACPQDQIERPHDRVLINFCQLLKIKKYKQA